MGSGCMEVWKRVSGAMGWQEPGEVSAGRLVPLSDRFSRWDEANYRDRNGSEVKGGKDEGTEGLSDEEMYKVETLRKSA